MRIGPVIISVSIRILKSLGIAMRHPLIQTAVPMLVACLAGCAVTEPTDADRMQIHSAIAEDPAIRIDTLASRLGVSELAVVRALPRAYARPWDQGAESAWRSVQNNWPVSWIEVGDAAYLGVPDHVHVFPIQQAPETQGTLQIRLDWSAIEAVWLVQKPMGSGMRREVLWFDASGELALRARWPDDTSDALGSGFDAMWDQAGR